MTSEIAVMNKEAIAIAADSAVTLSQGSKKKIFTSANKIFSLSKYFPVGIMIYGNAEFMDVPWEVIIKAYKRHLGELEKEHLGEYASDFLDFLAHNNELFTIDQQLQYFKDNLYGYFHNRIKTNIEISVKEIIETKGNVSTKEIESIINDIIFQNYQVWNNANLIDKVTKTKKKQLQNKYIKIIKNVIDKVFEKLPLSKQSINHLLEIGISLVLKYPDEIKNTSNSGIVIAGFGKNDCFPCLQAYILEGCFENILKYFCDEEKCHKISLQESSAIIAFAQSETIYGFIEGVDPFYQKSIEADLRNIFKDYPDVLIDSIDSLSSQEKSEKKVILKKISNKLIEDYISDLSEFRYKNYIEPIISVVNLLPKNELAMMAETFLKLTSFKRKVTPDAETVSEPIDVAVISKGDGLIWIKRKHYFEPELNPKYFANYFRGEHNDKIK